MLTALLLLLLLYCARGDDTVNLAPLFLSLWPSRSTALLGLITLRDSSSHICAVSHAGTALQESQIVARVGTAEFHRTVLAIYSSMARRPSPRHSNRSLSLRTIASQSCSGLHVHSVVLVGNSRRRNLEPNQPATDTWCYIGSNPGRPIRGKRTRTNDVCMTDKGADQSTAHIPRH
ncbi:hypothetical protein EDB87DRAFT_679772 [Lactarius vividus]|nr:hypothetical protein EDB87DRAFT_679772 [Lactarius vividus]